MQPQQSDQPALGSSLTSDLDSLLGASTGVPADACDRSEIDDAIAGNNATRCCAAGFGSVEGSASVGSFPSAQWQQSAATSQNDPPVFHDNIGRTPLRVRPAQTPLRALTNRPPRINHAPHDVLSTLRPIEQFGVNPTAVE